MIRRISTVLVVSLMLSALLAMPAFASKAPVVQKRTGGISVNKAMQYSYPEEPQVNGEAVSEDDRPSLGTPSSSFYTDSRGRTIGSTWYDYQHNGTMGRMIDWGWSATEGLVVHMNWMKLPIVNDRRHYRYEAWLGNVSTGVWSSGPASGGTMSGGIDVQNNGDKYAGYVGIDVTQDPAGGPNRAMVGGHENPGAGGYQSTFYLDGAVGQASFAARSARVPDALASCAFVIGATEAIWPKFRYQEGTANVLHVFAQGSETGAGTPQAIAYFRRIAANELDPPNTGWQACVVMDTVYDIAQDIDASTTSDRVVLAWTGNLPVSGSNPWESDNNGGSQINNDVFIATSVDQGAHFDPYGGSDRFNLTMSDSTVDGFRAYTDLSVLMDTQDKIHVAWTGRYWPADPNASIFWNCRLFHWGEDLGFDTTSGGGAGGPNVTPGIIRTVYDANWTIGTDPDQSQCTGGAWQMNIAKMTISECNGRLYVLWTQFNDPPEGIIDDCAARAAGGTGDLSGSANGDLYVAVSSTMLGLLWDDHRNITQSYSGGCDPEGAPGDCESDHWASMAQLGTNLTASNWPTDDAGNSIHVDISPLGDYGGSHYLDVMYINDNDAGGVVQTEGTWQNSAVKWLRLGCVDPVPNPIFTPSWSSISYPAWTNHGVQADTSLTIENTGNVDLVYFPTPVADEDPGPYSGWLSFSNFSGTVLAGTNNTETGTVHLNTGGIVNGAPGTVVNLTGRLIFVHNGASSPDTLPISFWVADTVVPPTFDTIWTGPTAMIGTGLPLIVGSNGNFGKEGNDDGGKANLDYYAAAPPQTDCDTNATTVVYDASPVIGWIEGSDTIMNWSIFGDGYATPEGFKPVTHVPTGSGVDYDSFSAVFTSSDTSVVLEKTWWAPHDADSMQFVIQCLKLYTEVGGVSGLVVGEAMDIDLASDSGSDNGSAFDGTRQAIYQFGGNYVGDTVPDCQDEDLRYAGIAFIEGRKAFNCPLIDEGADPYGAYTASNGDYVYPANGFVASELYANMVTNEGYNAYTNANPDSQLIDLHTVMTFETGVSLEIGDTVKYYSVIASTHLTGESEIQQAIDEGKQWYRNHIQQGYNPADCGCCVLGGDVDHSGGIDVSDLGYTVDYLFRGGPIAPCFEEGDVNGSGGIDVSDLGYIVDYLFRGGPPPPPCP